MSRLMRSLTTLALAVLCATGAWAQSQATTGVIEGTVKDETGGVLPGATVDAAQHGDQLRAGDDRRAPTGASARRPAAARPLPDHGRPRGFRHPGPRGHRPRGRPDDQPADRAEARRRRGGDHGHRRGAGDRDQPHRGRGPHRRPTRSRACPTTAATSSTTPSSRPASPSSRAPTATSCRSTARRASPTTSRSTAPTSTTPSSASSAAASGPPFTFNLDAVQEVVVVADGAPAEFGRSSGGFVNVVTKSGTNEIRGSAHAFYKNDSLSSDAEEPRRRQRRQGRLRPQAQVGFTLGGPLVSRTSSSTSSPPTPSAPTRTKQTDPARIDPRLVNFLAIRSACPTRTARSSAPTTPRWPSPRSTGRLSDRNLVTLRYSYTNSEQVNGTFDVDSWGARPTASSRTTRTPAPRT